MTQAEFEQQQRDGQVNLIPPTPPEKPAGIPPLALDEYQAVLEALRRPRRHLTSAPSFTPKNLLESIQFYDDGAARRIYFYINNNWRYATLT